MSAPLTIAYYSDILCVWAWIGEARNHELRAQWGDQVALDCHYLDLFADTKTRIGDGWRKKGGYEGFAEHIRRSAAPYELQIHEDVWTRVRPSTSANAHLILKAAQLNKSADAAQDLASRIRKAFFSQAADIGQLEVLYDLAQEAGLDPAELRGSIRSGLAIAELLADTKEAHRAAIAGSPTWILNDGRQTLYGNIGYRVLRANIEELLRHPESEASWC
jgi:predicted DsbA family dithiol-disulfide isomerase